jgi:hypothetical protein
MNIIIGLGILSVLAALAAAGYFMLRGGAATDSADMTDAQAQAAKRRMARALTVRISVSLLVFLAILLAWHFGYLKPTGIPAGK